MARPRANRKDGRPVTSELVEQLDAKYPGWQMWRSAMSAWWVKMPNPNETGRFQPFEVSDPTIEGVLAKAVAFVPLPLIPRRPRPVNRHDLRAVRDGGKWTLREGETLVHANLKTKREAEECADRYAGRTREAADKWDDEFGKVAAGVEGVDFAYRSW